ncbi:MAG: universal stress protein [Methanomicrobiales archaeon]|nr:universal stress protein [Methanomicrobiales archaeon]
MMSENRLEKVLVPLDMGVGAQKLLSAVEEIARIGVEEIALLHVVNVRDAAADPHIAKYDAIMLTTWKERLLACGVQKVTTEVANGIPWIEILERSEQESPSLIVLGSHGRSMVSRMLLGSTTEQVIRKARTPALILRMKIIAEDGTMVCRLATDRILRRIMYLTDFSEYATSCLPCLAWMVPARPEEVLVVHIQDFRPFSDVTPAQREEFNRRDAERLKALQKQLESAGFGNVTPVLKIGNAIIEILDLAREREVSLIVMGARGMHGIPERLLGGVTDAVVHRSGSHVLVVR